MPQVSIIVPAYNEEEGIVPTLEDVAAAVKGLDAEILVVDDGSSDGTVELAQHYATKVLKHSVNRGKGAAMKTGYEASTGDIVVFLDADGTYPARYIPDLVHELKEADACFTCRINREHIPAVNRLGNWLLTRLIRKLCGFVGHDPLSGLYGLRRHVIDAVGLESSTFAIETEIVVKVSRMRFHAVEIPITYRPRLGLSKLHRFRDPVRFLRVLFDLLFIFRPYLTFGLPGVAIFLAGLILTGVLVFKGTVSVGGAQLGLQSFLAGLALMLLGINAATYGGIIDLYAVRHRFKKPSRITGFLVGPAFVRSLRRVSWLLILVSVPVLAVHFSSWVSGGCGFFAATRAWMLGVIGLILGLQGTFMGNVGRIFAKDCQDMSFTGPDDQPCKGVHGQLPGRGVESGLRSSSLPER